MVFDRRRRQVLGGLATLAALPLLSRSQPVADSSLWLSSFRAAEDCYALCGFRRDGELAWRYDSAQRAHDMVAHAASDRVVFFARRPGLSAWQLALHDGGLQRELRAPANAHFNGHGVLSADGHTLYSTETAYGPARGQIGVWDLRSGRRLGEFPSGGLDPHQALLMDDGRTLVVANGGLLTAAGDERAKLNVDTMQPTLAYIDVASGKQRRLEVLHNHQLSIRHLGRLPQGRLAVGLQYEGPAEDDVAMVAIAGATQGWDALAAPPQGWQVFDHYVASLRADREGQHLAVTSPRGNTVGIWDLASGRHVEQLALGDVAGVAPAARGFLLTSGLGVVADWRAGRGLAVQAAVPRGMAWDNHLEEAWLA